MTTILTASAGSFDQATTFKVQLPQIKRFGQMVDQGTVTCYLFIDSEGNAFCMQRAGCLKDSYTQADRDELARLAAMEPLRNGDSVEIEGKAYTLKVLGNYSDAGRFIPA